LDIYVLLNIWASNSLLAGGRADCELTDHFPTTRSCISFLYRSASTITKSS